MQVVIDISDKFYKSVCKRWKISFVETTLMTAIAKGTPLPKGHGRLGDLDALREEVSSWGMNDYEPSDFIDEIDRAATIIDAESEGGEDA